MKQSIAKAPQGKYYGALKRIGIHGLAKQDLNHIKLRDCCQVIETTPFFWQRERINRVDYSTEMSKY